jgi:uncharacterized protein
LKIQRDEHAQVYKVTSLIDIHVHLHPLKLFRAIRAWFNEHQKWDFCFKDLNPEAIAAHLQSQNVERFVFCSYAHKPGIAHDINTWIAEASKALKYHGLGLATVHLGDQDPVGDMEQALQDGCIGLKIHEVVQKIYIDDVRFDAILAMIEKAQGMVLLHVDQPIDRKKSVTIPQRIASVLDKHPELKLVLAHFGGKDVLDFMKMTDKYKNIWLDTTWVFGNAAEPALPFVTDELLEQQSDRLVYGTDFPLTPWPYGRELENLRSRGLGPATLQKLFHDNAVRLLDPWLDRYRISIASP